MENNSEFGQLFLNLFLPMRDEDKGGSVVPSALCPLHQVFQFLGREFWGTTHNPEMITLRTSDEGCTVIILDFQNVIVCLENQPLELPVGSCLGCARAPRFLSSPLGNYLGNLVQ